MRIAATRLFGAICAATAVVAVAQVLRGASPLLSWAALALTALPPLVVLIGGRRLDSIAGRPPLAITLLSGLGLAVTMALSWRYGSAAGSVHAWAGGVFIGWAAWLRWGRPPT